MSRSRTHVLSLIGAVLALFTPALVHSAEPGQPCMGCHRPRETTIDPDRYAESVHRNVACPACHADGFASFPHEARAAAAPDCMSCHGGVDTAPYDFVHIEKGVQASVHTRMAGGTFRCSNCHSPHYFVPATRMTDAAAAARRANGSCLHCHVGDEAAAAAPPALGRVARQHQWLPHWQLHLSAAPCIACHTSREQRPDATSAALDAQRMAHVVLPATQAQRDCVGCHSQNSLLVTKLYAYLAWKERAERGWLNAVLFNNAYVTGATRNWWLDWATLIMTGMTIVGIALHAAGRWLGARARRRS